MTPARQGWIRDGGAERKKGCGRVKGTGINQGADGGSPEAMSVSLDFILLQRGVLWDFKMPASSPLWLHTEDEFGGRVEIRSPGGGREPMVQPAPQ